VLVSLSIVLVYIVIINFGIDRHDNIFYATHHDLNY